MKALLRKLWQDVTPAEQLARTAAGDLTREQRWRRGEDGAGAPRAGGGGLEPGGWQL